jgi:hypothetical protein
MVFASKNACSSFIVEHHGKRPVPTNVQECVKFALTVSDDEEWIACNCESRIAPHRLQTKLVGDE